MSKGEIILLLCVLGAVLAYHAIMTYLDRNYTNGKEKKD